MLNKAMIMAAGVGSRLGALSDMIPKPLVPVANIPVMDILIKHISSFGIKNIIANTYYKSDMIIEHYSKENKNFNISFIKEDELSGTAGGFAKCKHFFNENDDILVLSGDGLTDFNLKAAFDSHKKSGAIATIVIKKIPKEETKKYGIIVPGPNGRVQSFQEKPSIDEAKSNLANTGIYIFNYRIFDYIPQNTFFDFAKNVFPALMQNNEKINTYETYGYWSDVGSIDQYIQSNKDVLWNKFKFAGTKIKTNSEGIYITDDSAVWGQYSVADESVIGRNCTIGTRCYLKNTVIWDNVEIKDFVTLKNCIVLSGAKVEKSYSNMIITPDSQEEITV